MKCPNPSVGTFAIPKATVLVKDMFGKDKHKTGRPDLVLIVSLHPTAAFELQGEIRRNGILLYLMRDYEINWCWYQRESGKKKKSNLLLKDIIVLYKNMLFLAVSWWVPRWSALPMAYSSQRQRADYLDLIGSEWPCSWVQAMTSKRIPVTFCLIPANSNSMSMPSCHSISVPNSREQENSFWIYNRDVLFLAVSQFKVARRLEWCVPWLMQYCPNKFFTQSKSTLVLTQIE